MKTGNLEKISDDLIGQDDKICSCSAQIAELIKNAGQDQTGNSPLLTAMAKLKPNKQEKNNRTT
ncbi:MAG: hypothetical protein OEY01_08150 [Desulfobulbaceae bacterium]|nr:hypothetical protein [Desulfobulbaceae bacterium]